MTHNDYDDFEGLAALRNELADMLPSLPNLATDGIRNIGGIIADRETSTDAFELLGDTVDDIHSLLRIYQEAVTEAKAYRQREPIAKGDRFKWRGDTYVVTEAEPPSFKFNEAQRASRYRWELRHGVHMGKLLMSGKLSTASTSNFSYRQLLISRSKDTGWGKLTLIQEGAKQ